MLLISTTTLQRAMGYLPSGDHAETFRVVQKVAKGPLFLRQHILGIGRRHQLGTGDDLVLANRLAHTQLYQ